MLDVQAVQRIYKATESWIQVAGDVSSVCSLSQVGRKLFAWAQVYVVSARLTDHIDKLLCMLNHDDVTKLSIDEVIQESMKEADSQKASEVLLIKREVQLQNRGIDLQVAVTSWAEEFHIRIACNLKSRFVSVGVLELKFEPGLFNPTKLAPMQSICEPSLIAECIACRKSCNELIDQVPMDGAIILDRLEKKAQVLPLEAYENWNPLWKCWCREF